MPLQGIRLGYGGAHSVVCTLFHLLLIAILPQMTWVGHRFIQVMFGESGLLEYDIINLTLPSNMLNATCMGKVGIRQDHQGLNMVSSDG